MWLKLDVHFNDTVEAHYVFIVNVIIQFIMISFSKPIWSKYHFKLSPSLSLPPSPSLPLSHSLSLSLPPSPSLSLSLSLNLNLSFYLAVKGKGKNRQSPNINIQINQAKTGKAGIDGEEATGKDGETEGETDTTPKTSKMEVKSKISLVS